MLALNTERNREHKVDRYGPEKNRNALAHVPYADVLAVERLMHRALPGRKALPSETKERGSVPGWSGQCLIVCGNQEPNNPYSGVDRGRVVQACPSPVFVKATPHLGETAWPV